jgi:predicted DsbA family dithiol-disulfide isomerase
MEAMARERYGLEINPGPFGINSRPALVGAHFAEAQGVGEAYHDAVFRAYWQDAKNIEDLDVLAGLATAVGLNRDEFLAALDDPHYQQRDVGRRAAGVPIRPQRRPGAGVQQQIPGQRGAAV